MRGSFNKIWLIVGFMALTAPVNSKPNIIFLFADDLGWLDVSTGHTNGGRGSNIFETPNVDSIATQGMSFTHAYTQQNCAPTRAALISGMYATRPHNQVFNVTSLHRADERTEGFPDLPIVPYDQQKSISEKTTTIFDMIKAGGYKTCMIGKNHGTPSTLNKMGVDTFVPINKVVKAKVNGVQKSSEYLAIKDDAKGWVFDHYLLKPYAQPYDSKYISTVLTPLINGNNPSTLIGTPKHLTDATGDFAVDYIKTNAGGTKPFFLYVPFHAIHTKITGRADLTAKYSAKGLSADSAEYASMIELLDQNVGKIRNSIKDPNGDGDFSDDISENTLLIFTSDNGGLKGSPPLKGKKGMYTEGGIRVPMIFRWPGVIKPNTISNQAMHIIDMYPTLADIAGVNLSSIGSPSLDGVSVAKILKGDAQRLSREELYWHFPGYMDVRMSPTSLIQKRVNDDYYKLFYYYETGKFALYQISTDIGEQNDLLKTPTAETVKLAGEMGEDLRKWLVDMKARTGKWASDSTTVVPYPSIDSLPVKILPTVQKFNIHYKITNGRLRVNNLPENSTLYLLTLDGKQLMIRKGRGHSMSFDIRNFEKGAYILSIRDSSGIVLQKVMLRL